MSHEPGFKFPTVWTLEKRNTFLRLLAETGSVTESAAGSGLSRTTLYDYRAADPEFAAEWEKSLDASVDALEDIARERARSKSDLLMMFMLKGARPAKYRDNATINVRVERLELD